MPVVSQRQGGFMGASQSPEGRAKLIAKGIKPAPVKVAHEFLQASKGKSFKRLPVHVPAHHSKVHAATHGKSL